jgi:phosphoserine phosphatase
MRRLRRVGTVVFDCDSTLSSIEGIEELAGERVEEVAALTAAAMDGALPLEAVYGRRLDLVRPTRAELEALGARYMEHLVPDARATMAALREEGIQVRVISGGLLPAVLPFAQALGVSPEHVAAVDVRFDADGRYRGFDDASPLARAGGKRDLLTLWRREAPGPIMLVGDGATDLEAQPVVDVFVAYAGVVDRPAVTERAEFVLRAPSLLALLPLALGGAPPRVASTRPLYERGYALLDADARRFLEYTPTSELRDG